LAERPVFIPNHTGKQLVIEKNISFHWNPGMSISQKRKNIVALHEAASMIGVSPILEVSTKSDQQIGNRLSAFNLKVRRNTGTHISLESAFQGSKVFKYGGPYSDLYGKSGFECKKDERLKNSGELVSFCYDGIEWDLSPHTAFYDWLYVNAVHSGPCIDDVLLRYNGFSDIEFNPAKSINCQARSCALYVSLKKRKLLENAIKDKDCFIELVKNGYIQKTDLSQMHQGSLF